MIGPLSSRVLPTMVLVVSVLECAAKPPEKPIVLRPHHPERPLARRPLMPPPAETVATPVTLSPEENEHLFRNLETCLSRPGMPQ